MRLGEKQELFMRLLPDLINKAHSLGFEIRGGDLFRDPREHGEFGEERGVSPGFVTYGHKKSCHKLKLAIDLNLRRRGESKMVTSTKGHQELGEWWEKQHELCRWGGNFKGKGKADGNHYSLTHWGAS